MCGRVCKDLNKPDRKDVVLALQGTLSAYTVCVEALPAKTCRLRAPAGAVLGTRGEQEQACGPKTRVPAVRSPGESNSNCSAGAFIL